MTTDSEPLKTANEHLDSALSEIENVDNHSAGTVLAGFLCVSARLCIKTQLDESE